MTLGVTGVVWLPRTATVNSTSLLAGAGPVPLSVASGSWQTVAAAFTDTAVTVGRVMAVLAAGWEGDAANAAHERLGGFMAWAQASAARAGQVSASAASEAAAYSTAALAMPNPVEIATVKGAKTAAYASGGALNGSAQALELADRALDLRAGAVMEGYELATTPLAVKVSFDHPPRIVTDGVGAVDAAGKPIDQSQSYRETGVFGFSPHTSPAQAAVAAISTAFQNPGIAGAISQAAGTAGSIAGSSVTTVASAATNIGGAAVSSLMNSNGTQTHSLPSTGYPAAQSSSPARTMSAAAMPPGSGGAGGAGTSNGGSTLGSSRLGQPPAGTTGLAQQFALDRGAGTPFGPGSSVSDPARSGAHGGAPVGGTQRSGEDDDEHETPGYLKQFEHFSDGRTVAPSVIGADPTWNDR